LDKQKHDNLNKWFHKLENLPEFQRIHNILLGESGSAKEVEDIQEDVLVKLKALDQRLDRIEREVIQKSNGGFTKAIFAPVTSGPALPIKSVLSLDGKDFAVVN